MFGLTNIRLLGSLTGIAAAFSARYQHEQLASGCNFSQT
jgi:hypothetical protein